MKNLCRQLWVSQFPTWMVDLLLVACHVLILVFALSSLGLVSFLDFHWQQ